MTIFRTKDPPEEKEWHLWWTYAKRRRDWYMLIVQDQISSLYYPVYVPEFDELNFHVSIHHRQNDQWVIHIYETWGE